MPWRQALSAQRLDRPPGCGTDPEAALLIAADSARPETLRLFLCACARHGLRLGTDDRRVLRAVEVAERFAHGAATGRELGRAAKRAAAAERVVRKRLADSVWDVTESFFFGRIQDELPPLAAAVAATSTDEALMRAAVREVRSDRRLRAAAPELLRELLKCPVPAPVVDPAWLWRNGGAVRDIARLICEDGALANLPILADALMDAGCEDGRILDHCRFPHEHLLPHGKCHGCWVLDTVCSP
jgi:hypothetical protein